MSVVISKELTKNFGDLEAVRGISFEIEPGECVGLLGPNAAGKTTSLSMIGCLTPPSSGLLKVFGKDVVRFGREIRHRLGIVPQAENLDPDLTAQGNAVVYANYFGIPKAEARRRASQLFGFFGLDHNASTPVLKLPAATRRRLLIARALINSPEFLILDEPTEGLDPQARQLIWQKIRMLKAQGITVLICTHHTDEAEALCDRLSIIDSGRILGTGSPQELIARYAGEEVMELFDLGKQNPELIQSLLNRSLPSEVRIERSRDSIYCFTPCGARFPMTFIEQTRREQVARTVRRATLEDVFLHLTGRELRE